MFKVFVFGFKTRIKTILPLINRLINEALLVTDHISIRCCSCSCCCVSVSVGVSKLCCISVFSMQPGVKVHSAYCDVLLLRHLLPDILTSCWRLWLSRVRRARKSTELLGRKTRDFTSHQTWHPKRPDLNPVDYRIWTVTQECVYEKQQRTSNIINELLLVTLWTYISQGRIETPIRRGGQFCCRFVANLLQYLCQ